MFGGPHNDYLERWEIQERIDERAARGRDSKVLWKRPRFIVAAMVVIFFAAGVRGRFVDKTPSPSSRLTVQTAGFDGIGFKSSRGFRTQSRNARRSQFSRLVLRTPDAAEWPELDEQRRIEERALVRSMLQEPFDGNWCYLNRGLRGDLDGVAGSGANWGDLALHWSHTNSGNIKMLRGYHKNVRRIEGGMAYHFVIGNGSGAGDGEIAVGERWSQVQGSGAAVPESVVSICMIGDGEPTSSQSAALRELVIYLEAKVGELIHR